ncbi:MAG: hypothetical protein AB9897_06520 [Anaerolineaceae bacterium]
MEESRNQNTKLYFIGGAAGLLLGLAAVSLLIKNQENNPDGKSIITSKDGLTIGVGLASLLKQIADLGRIH